MSVRSSDKSELVVQEDSILDVDNMESSDDMEQTYSELVDELVTVVKDGRESEQFEELMDTLAVAGNYSAQNKFLIKVQDPNAIGPFNGYNQWINNFGRVPEEGTSALWVLAPNTVDYCEDSDDPVKYCDECDECDDTRSVLVGFSSVPTFAYSQTVELPEEDKPDNIKDISVISEKEVQTSNDKNKMIEWYESLIQSYEDNGFEVKEAEDTEEWDVSTGARGYFKHDDKSITIRNFRIGNENNTVNVEERLSTLIHEVAHSYLEHDEESISDSKKEMEAEAVAYIVCQRLNIETDAGVYISNHLSSEIEDLTDEEQIRDLVVDSVERIGDVSGQIIEGIRQN